jgi:hypothetical protein
MINKHRLICFALTLFSVLIIKLFIFFQPASAQYFTIGSDPETAKWMELKSDNFSIIYPLETDSLARKYLYQFEKTIKNSLVGLKIDPPHVPLVLHPYTTSSNGTVVWAPKRVELISTPSAYRGFAQNWEKQLALHEGRHLGQMAHYTKGVFSILSFILGEQSVGLGIGFYPSVWLLEGDATLNETDFSETGRGRDANFLMYFRASFLNGDIRDYDHWRYGSYNYFTPDKYAFGYLIGSTMRYCSNNYYFSGDTMESLVDLWWNIGGWNISFQKAVGLTPRKYWKKATFLMSDIWKNEYKNRGYFTPTESIVFRKEPLYTTYSSPLPLNNNNTIVLKSGFEHSRQLVLINETGEEKIIRPFAPTTSDLIKKNDSLIYWSETVPDIRWELKNYSIIRSFDINTKKIKDITQKTRYFNPTFSQTKDTLSVIEYPVEGSSYLVLLDSESGEVKARYEAPFNSQLTYGAWINNYIFCTAITENGMGIYRIDVTDPKAGWKNEVPDQSRWIQGLKSVADKLLFQSDLDGITNIYFYTPETKFLQRLTNARFGAFSPSYDTTSNTLYFTDFDNLGYHPVKSSSKFLDWSPASFDKPYHYQIAEFNAAQAKKYTEPISEEEDIQLQQKIASIRAKKYNKSLHLFNIHSWAPFYANVNRIMKMSFDEYYQLASLGVTLLSQNTLGTAVSQFGYSYHEGFHSGHINFNYTGLFPVFEFSADFNDRHKTVTSIIESHINSDVYPITYHIDTLSSPALNLSLKAYIPINLSHSGWNSGLIPEISYNFCNDEYSLFGNQFRNKQGLSYGIRYYKTLSSTKTNLFPRWGFGVSIKGAFNYGPHNENGNITYIYGYGYLPGITLKQGLKLTASYQKQYCKNAFGFVPNLASMPRGYNKLILLNYAKVSADYAIPVYLGDVSCSWLFYLKRLQIIPFADMAINTPANFNNINNDFLHPKNDFLYSYGSDFLLDAHFFRIGRELSIGFRYARTGENKNYFNFLFSTDLY